MTEFEKWINNAHMTDKDSDPTQRDALLGLIDRAWAHVQ